ncbi:MAG TPA: TIGR03936 family radical SAM-associated protein, partial [Caldilineaceae bacterium]|nr:TIGR03936 family radical SAM-associated protein [Caldilineaceae bacterium]
MADATLSADLGNESLRQRIRLNYEKGEAIKFISHQDEFRLWERTLRRADLPLLYSQGFSPQPQIQFASPLGVGITGVSEFVDITLSVATPLDEVAERIAQSLPPGVVVHGIEEVPLKSPGLQNTLIGADYTILIYAEADEIAAELLEQRIAACLQQTTIWRERERKGEKYIYNLRPLLLDLS